MKKSPVNNCLLTLFLLLSAFCASAQMAVEVTVVDDRQALLPGASVALQELATHQVLRAASDRRGIARFSLNVPGEYELSVNGQVQSSDPVRVLPRQTGSTSLYVTYNPALQERTRRQTFDRSGLTDVAVQGQVAPEDVAEGFNRVEITVQNSAGQRLPGKRVSLVSLARRKRYVASTDGTGVAFFHVPGKTAYDIDVEEQLNASFIIQENLEGYTLSQTVVYDQYDMTETVRNDTVLQQVQLPITDKHSRAVYRIRVRREGKAWANGPVFLDETHSRRVYKARTDANGEAVFILPFGKRYLVHFPYERDVDVVNLADARSIASGSLDLTYVPNPALEHPERFVPRPDQLQLTHFPYYHRTAYPQRPGGPGLTLRSGGAGPGALLEIGVTAGSAAHARPPLNLSFVLDISGSMAGDERIESLKRGLALLLGQMREQDIVSITLFNDGPRLLVPAQPLGKDRRKIIDLVQGIEPSGGTNMRKALEVGYAQAARFYRAGSANTLVLLSDGWDSNPADTLLAVQQPWKDRIQCTAIGVGNDYNHDLLKRLVTQGAELLLQAHEGRELEQLFAQKLVALTVPIMRGVSVEVRTEGNLQCMQAFGFRSVDRVPGGFNATLPDLFPGQELPLLATFGPGGPARATVTFRYTDVVTGKRGEYSESVQLSCNESTASDETGERRKMFAVAFANDCLQRMAVAFEKQDWKEAARMLTVAQEQLKRLYPDLKETDIRKLWEQTVLYATALKNISYKKKIGD